MKTCITCKEEKDERDFHKHYRNKKRTKFNYGSYCKPCASIRNKEYIEKNREKLKVKRDLRRKKRIEFGFKPLDNSEKKKQQNCRAKTYRLLKSGKVKDVEFCQICGKVYNKIHRHHADYSRADIFVCMCQGCHMKVHWHVIN